MVGIFCTSADVSLLCVAIKCCFNALDSERLLCKMVEGGCHSMTNVGTGGSWDILWETHEMCKRTCILHLSGLKRI